MSMSPTVIVLTSYFPYGASEEAFFEPEMHALSQAFKKVIILPMKGQKHQRSSPENVEVWKPVRSAGRWFYVKQLLTPLTWRLLFSSVSECYKAIGFSRMRLKTCLIWSCFRAALLQHKDLSRLIDANAPLVLYAYWGSIPALVVPTAKQRGVPTCIRYHSIDLYVDRVENDQFLPWRDELRSNTDLSVFVSDHGLKYFQENRGAAPTGAAKVFRLGAPDFGPPRARPDRFDPDAPIVLVSASRIAPVKQVHLIARLAKDLARHRRTEWRHFGGGSSQALEQELAKDLPSNLTVTLMGDTPRDEILRYYRDNTITCFVNLSRYEGVPVSIMEALNADIPCVATDVGGTSEVVINGRSGMLVGLDECSDAQTLAEHILVGLQPGGRLSASTPRMVWEALYSAELNAAAFVEELVVLGDHKARI
jgi:glycosyltransferase involved in cell wall biosynthesis